MIHDNNQQLDYYTLRKIIESELESALAGALAKEFTKGLAAALARGYSQRFAIEFAQEFAQGMREGIAIGEARSKARNIENSLAIAQRMIAAGYDRETIRDLYGRLPLRSKQPQISCFLPVYGSYDYHKELKSDCRYSAKSRFRWLFTQRWHTTVQVETIKEITQLTDSELAELQ